MKRREFITLLSGTAAWPLVARAQQQDVPLIGFLFAGTAQALRRDLASFREEMRRFGYVEGSNVRFEFRFADGYLERLSDLAADLVSLNPRVIVSAPLPAHLAARRATGAIPIVMALWCGPGELWIGGQPLPPWRERDGACKLCRNPCAQANRLDA